MLVRAVSYQTSSYWYSNMINSIFEVEEFDYTTQYVVKKIVLLNKHYPDGIFFSREGTQFSTKKYTQAHYLQKEDVENAIKYIRKTKINKICSE